MTGLVTTGGAEFLALIERDVPLKLAASTNGGEYAGPCPFCQEGEDRFRVWPQHPDHGGKGRFWCRVCDLSGDAGDFLKYRDGLESDRAALEVLGALEGANNAAPSKPRRGNGHRSRQSRPRAKIGPIVGEYLYRDATGAPVMRVTRHERLNSTTGEPIITSKGKPDKTFKQWRPDGAGGWKPGIKGHVEPILYNLPDVLEGVERGDVIWLVEGEAKVDALRAKAKIATCCVGGAGKWQDAYSERLRGAHIAILPDNDAPGREHAQQAARSLQGRAASVKIVELPGLDETGDVVNWIAAGGTSGDLHLLYRDAYEWEPSAARQIDESKPWAERMKAYAAEMGIKLDTTDDIKSQEPITYLVDGNKLPDASTTMLYGPPGCGKSFLALNWAGGVAAQEKSVFYVINEGQRGYRNRAAAWEQHHKKSLSDRVIWQKDAINLYTGENFGTWLNLWSIDPPDLVIFDSLQMSMVGADENGGKDMSHVISRCQAINALGTAVLLVHHTRKDGTAYRGHSSMLGDIDMMIGMSGTDRMARLTCEKTKDDERFKDERYELIVITLPDGETSCVVMPTDKVMHTDSDELTATELRVLEVLAQSIYVEAGCGWKRLCDEAGASNSTMSVTLSRLKDRGMIRQASRGEPYFIEPKGLIAAGVKKSLEQDVREVLLD